ncbi:MAG: TetR/AcrR family transcriptional regulator [Candidatus Limnocylindria bacterium]
MPRLWEDTIETHRRAVRVATVDTTATLIARHGLRAVTMSQIAEETGIGRATLYKYFPDVESILRAWHEREIGRHLEQLARARDEARDPDQRLRAVLDTFARIAHGSHGHHDAELAALLHRDEHVIRAQHELKAIIRDLMAEAAAAGSIRNDVAADELAAYCIHALAAAATLPSSAAVARLVDVTLAGLQAPR